MRGLRTTIDPYDRNRSVLTAYAGQLVVEPCQERARHRGPATARSLSKLFSEPKCENTDSHFHASGDTLKSIKTNRFKSKAIKAKRRLGKKFKNQNRRNQEELSSIRTQNFLISQSFNFNFFLCFLIALRPCGVPVIELRTGTESSQKEENKGKL